METINSSNKKSFAKDDLQDFTKEELIDRIGQLEASVIQLKNIIKKSGETKTDKKKKTERPFDFNKFTKRHVALKIAYLGWDYQGFAAQIDTNKTIEAAIFEALMKTKLIENRETSFYHRCGRTDKGVSAFSQVISIDLRSNLTEGKGVKTENFTGSKNSGTDEIPYVHILNKVLPAEIRVLAWCPVEPDFSARFSCTSRTYKYVFPRGNLNIERMRLASLKLIGQHDFRNFCKMDLMNGVVTYERRILDVTINPIHSSYSSSSSSSSCLELQSTSTENRVTSGEYDMIELTVTGLAFLWHQIRCIVAVLFLIGLEKEEPQIIDELLDISKHPRKPQYTMASELPLVLFDCQFEDLNWIYEKNTLSEVVSHFQSMWTKHSVRATMTKRMLEELEQVYSATADDSSDVSRVQTLTDCLLPGNKPNNYKRLLDREKCEGLDERIEHYAKKRKFNNNTNNS